MDLEMHPNNKTCAACSHIGTCAPQIAYPAQRFCVYTPSRFKQAGPVETSRQPKSIRLKELPSW